MDNRAIGILDTGIGGLTVAKEIRKMMPKEDLLYYGDSIHCPYGIRTEDNIIDLTKQILDYMRRKEVKAVVVACNTISTLVDRLQEDYEFPIFSVIEPVVDYIKEIRPESLGFLSTAFTSQKGTYRELFARELPEMRFMEDSSKVLATIIDSGNFESDELRSIVERKVQNIQKEGAVQYLLLACTHYPIISSLFREYAGETMQLIDPARYQAQKVMKWLEAEDRLAARTHKGNVKVLSSGDLRIYQKAIEHMEMEGPIFYKGKVLKNDSFFGPYISKKRGNLSQS